MKQDHVVKSVFFCGHIETGADLANGLRMMSEWDSSGYGTVQCVDQVVQMNLARSLSSLLPAHISQKSLGVLLMACQAQ